jgi:ABC-2 type transport system ATP-binding protein
MAAISLKDVSKSYGAKQALLGVSLEIEEGQIWGLLGRNAAGKSTLIKCLLGLAKPDSGSASVGGEDSWSFSPELKEKLGYSAQEPDLFGWMKAGRMAEHVGAFYRNWDQGLFERLAKEWRVDLAGRIDKMSPGERQKLSLLIALAPRPEILVLDEPASALDPEARRDFLKAVLDAAAERRGTVLFSTHITSDLERIADHVAVLRNGRMAFSGELDSLLERFEGNLEEAFISLNQET